MKKVVAKIIIFMLAFGSLTSIALAEESSSSSVETPNPPASNVTPQESSSSSESAESEPDRLPTHLENQEELQSETLKKPVQTPRSVTGEKYEGSGTVVDFTTTVSKAFYTIKAQDNSVYYLIIDLDKTENNVYFLSEINGEQLTLKEVAAKNTTGMPVEQPVAATKEVPSSTSNYGDWVFGSFVVIASIGVILYYYFFKFKKNKRAKAQAAMHEDEDDELVIYEDDEY